MVRATSIKDVDQHEAVKSIAHFLKKSGKVKVPEWTDLVKLGVHKELSPIDPDWFYTRTASLARHLYFRSAGIGAFKKIYGGNKRRGVAPNHFQTASGNCLRKAIQQLEKLKWVEAHPDGKGRVLSKQGRKDLDRIATTLRSSAAPAF
ncbi:unnamed protein product [Caenorhabditis bovis]|uniref:40S ribosomal protein S19 n=1 Tax=Caenorhabditis bovis TaxID=2654633 RepID=A0A8S1FAP5_9PELO|nr:unnamed protein product [Caenorhabditis bovis]